MVQSIGENINRDFFVVNSEKCLILTVFWKLKTDNAFLIYYCMINDLKII